LSSGLTAGYRQVHVLPFLAEDETNENMEKDKNN
jgi:hypothetical protein